MASLDTENLSTRGLSASSAGVLRLFVATLFLSALLLFSVQPMFAKMVLPKLGGSPSVWAVSMCFFQAVLLAGYLYAHLLNRYVPGRAGGVIHLVLMALATLALPFGLPQHVTPPVGDSYIWLLGVLAAGVGVPFFIVSANAPLLQSWFVRSGHPHAADPYFLYGASNLGSLLALLSYPLLIEPSLGLTAQAGVWTGGFNLLTLFVALSASAALVLSGRPSTLAGPSAARGAPTPIAWSQRLVWIALAFTPSALLTAYTTHLTTDIVSAPFLWVLPLAAYLATFVIVFRDKPLIPDAWIANSVAPLACAALFGTIAPPTVANIGIVLLSALAFMAVMLQCHRTLFQRRPEAGNLTEFYLWMSFGGVLGGAFASLLAPRIFDTVLEYPLLYVIAIAGRASVWKRPSPRERRVTVIFAVAVAAIVAAAWLVTRQSPSLGEYALKVLIPAATIGSLLWRSDVKRCAILCFAAFVCLVAIPKGRMQLSSTRNFFGVVQVSKVGEDQFRGMFHGTTLHGAERIFTADGRPVGTPAPSTYYHSEGPLARGVEIARVTTGRQGALFGVGVVGLGVGTMACYAKPDEHWRFYEIDPAVVKTASDPKNFSFLTRCPPSEGVVLGDARLTLDAEPRAKLDYLIVDAFSSDSVPAHLLTREAIALYLDVLKPDGLLALHVSSRFMALPAVASTTAASLPGVKVAIVESQVPSTSFDATASNVVFVSRAEAPIAAAMALPGARSPASARPIAPWSDDYSDVAGAIWLQLWPRP